MIQDEKTWLLAKARTLKEHAVATADRSSRTHLLRLAGEYQKLAHAGMPGDDDLASDRVSQKTDGYGKSPVPTKPSSRSRRSAARGSDNAKRGNRADIYGIMLLSVLTLLAFTLVMMPGDQTLEALRGLAAELARL